MESSATGRQVDREGDRNSHKLLKSIHTHIGDFSGSFEKCNRWFYKNNSHYSFEEAPDENNN